MGGDRAADLQEQAHAAGAVDLVDVDDVAALQDDQIGRLSRLPLDRLQMLAGGELEALDAVLEAARELEQLVPDQVPPAARALRRIAALDERGEQPVRGAGDQAGAGREIGDAELPGARERLEQVERPVERLDSRLRHTADTRTSFPSFETNVQGAVPQHVLAERAQPLVALHDREEVVAGELADDAREQRAAVGEQDLRFAEPAGVPEDLAGCRVARRVLGLAADADVHVAERNPGGFSAPARVDDLAVERQQRLEGGNRLGRAFALELGLEGEFACGDGQHGVSSLPDAGGLPRRSERTVGNSRPMNGEIMWRYRRSSARNGALAPTSARSASLPTAIAPLFAMRKRSAGPWAVSRATVAGSARVSSSGIVVCAPAIPPQLKK